MASPDGHELECDMWGTLVLITPIGDKFKRTVLGHVERAWERVPPGLVTEYLRLLDEHRGAFDSRAEQVAAWNLAKGLNP
jgi:hypothetical protein